MEQKPDTDFQQFTDASEFHARRSGDLDPIDCPTEGCVAVLVMERRLDRHREEINGLKTMIAANGKAGEKNSADTAEILEIVTMAKSFFKVLGWIGDKLKTIAAIFGFLAAILAYIKYGEWKL